MANPRFRLCAEDAAVAEARKALVSVFLTELVAIPGRDYLLGRHAVTQAQWEGVMGENPSCIKGRPDNPVENVSWDDCRTFLERLNALPEVAESGTRFRLPTEEEWEFAGRAVGGAVAFVVWLPVRSAVLLGLLAAKATAFLAYVAILIVIGVLYMVGESK